MRRRSSFVILLVLAFFGPTIRGWQQPPSPPPAGPPPARRRHRRRTRRRSGRGRGQITGGRRRRPGDVPAAGAERAKKSPPTVAGNRLPMQKDEQGVWSVTSSALARLLHLLARRRRHVDQRPEQPSGADEFHRVPDPCSSCPARAVASGARRRRGDDRAPPVSLGHRRRRPGLLRLHASRLRRPARESVSRALSAARPRRRCRAVDERRGGATYPRQPDRAGQSRADGRGDDARLRHERGTVPAPPARS